MIWETNNGHPRMDAAKKTGMNHIMEEQVVEETKEDSLEELP